MEFVGHPLVDLIDVQSPRDEFLRAHGLDPAAPTVALLPGSRPNELRATVPVLAAAMPLIAGRVPDVQFVVARAPHLPDALLDRSPPARAGHARASRVAIVEGRTDDVLHAADMVDDRVGHRHGADGTAREADGDRLPAVAADVSAGPAVRAGQHLRHGEPDRRAHGGARVDPGGVHAGPRGARRRCGS